MVPLREARVQCDPPLATRRAQPAGPRDRLTVININMATKAVRRVPRTLPAEETTRAYCQQDFENILSCSALYVGALEHPSIGRTANLECQYQQGMTKPNDMAQEAKKNLFWHLMTLLV